MKLKISIVLAVCLAIGGFVWNRNHILSTEKPAFLKYVPPWEEKYEHEVTRSELHYDFFDQRWETRQVFDHWEWRTRWHGDDYFFIRTNGAELWISSKRFNALIDIHEAYEKKARIGTRVTYSRGSQYISGDTNDYVYFSKTYEN